MNSIINTSPMNKQYNHSPGFKKQHPFNPDISMSLKNSMNPKDFQNEELEFYKARCQDLDQYVRQLKNELDTTIIRLSKNGSLDEKAELILRQNQILQQELDKLQKQFAQKKTECELWKNKYEQQLNAAVQLKAGYELDFRKMGQELKILEDRNLNLERDRSHDVEATKTNLSIQNEQQRHGYLQQIDLLESQLRKYRDYADERDKEIFDLENKLNRMNGDHEIIENRLLKDLDIMRIKLAENEREHQIEMNNVRQKLDILNQGQLDNLKQQYLTQLEIMDNEIDKLKGLLDIKNTEIETLIMQNQKLRQNYDDELNNVRLQYDILKEKMLENEQQFQQQLQDQDIKLRSQYQAEVDALHLRYQKEISILENQIKHLEEQNELKAIEIAKLQRDLQQKDQDQILELNHKLTEQRRQFENQIKNLEGFIDKQKKEIDQLNLEIQRLLKIIEVKDLELKAVSETFQQIREQFNTQLHDIHVQNQKLQSTIITQQRRYESGNKSLQNRIHYLEKQVHNYQLNIQQDSKSHSTIIQQLKENINQLNLQIKQLQGQVQALSAQNIEIQQQYVQDKKDLQSQIDQLQQNLNVQENTLTQEKEQALQEQIYSHEQLQDELQNEIDHLKADITLKDQQNQDLQEKQEILEQKLQAIIDEEHDKLARSHQLRGNLL